MTIIRLNDDTIAHTKQQPGVLGFVKCPSRLKNYWLIKVVCTTLARQHAIHNRCPFSCALTRYGCLPFSMYCTFHKRIVILLNSMESKSYRKYFVPEM